MTTKNYIVEATDTFQGTLGLRVFEGEDVIWAAYVFPVLSPKTEKVEWAADAYIGTQEVDYFIADLEVDGVKNSTLAKEIIDYLGEPTFDLPVLLAKLTPKHFTL